jgi:hypothetical protein
LGQTPNHKKHRFQGGQYSKGNEQREYIDWWNKMSFIFLHTIDSTIHLHIWLNLYPSKY